ncbi:kinase-like domain-containing protein, partial [Lipomyces oligophaga]|uniref:kinase-like domain-containing protein n=1 Tax=Lipomyces oligophaga TaxID=45792 RepID=UPI0034CEC3E5
MEKLSVPKALKAYGQRLNFYEKGEILDFKEIYFCGRSTCDKFEGDLTASDSNFDYDDKNGDYKIVEGDHLNYQFEILGLLGKGSFGQVVKCVDHKNGGVVAIKVIRNRRRFHSQAVTEARILQNLSNWDPEDSHHFVRVSGNFYFRNHLCIITELLSMNLYEMLKVNEFKSFPTPLIRRMAKQMLSSLCLLQREAVIHCDLKPENILLKSPDSSEIKMIDFGSSCLEKERMFTYIQSRFYRSPEVMLGIPYGLPIDMWSFGCILAELQIGYPIFPGETESDQIGCIMEVFGPPSMSLLQNASRSDLFFDSMGRPKPVIGSQGKKRVPNAKKLSQVLRTKDEAFIDFIRRCLEWDPQTRLRPDDAVRHAFIVGKELE